MLREAIGWNTWPDTSWSRGLLEYLANLAGCTNFILKAVLGVTVMMWVRWTLPRLRIDQVIAMCWKYCVPIAALCFVGALGWQFADLPSLNRIDRSVVREHWLLNENRLLPSQPDQPDLALTSPVTDGTEGSE